MRCEMIDAIVLKSLWAVVVAYFVPVALIISGLYFYFKRKDGVISYILIAAGVSLCLVAYAFCGSPVKIYNMVELQQMNAKL